MNPRERKLFTETDFLKTKMHSDLLSTKSPVFADLAESLSTEYQLRLGVASLPTYN